MTRSHLWILGGLFLTTAAQAQFDQAQLVRPSGAAELNSNLARLAANPRDVAALIGAGEAALSLDDARAAAGFFARADAAAPNNGRVKAGLGRVMLKMQNPAEALRLFEQARRLGYPETTFLSDRGLARDMTGDQAGAQRDYQAALRWTPDDPELVRRYAASLGISGQVEAADKLLQPLLYKSDRAAWRYNAFILAMNNRQAEAKKIVDQTMPVQIASAITPYMQKMPYLTAAQKAAAVHFGHFPTVVGSTITPVVPTPPAPGIALASREPAPVETVPAPASAAKPDRRTRRPDPRPRGTSLARAPIGSPAPQPVTNPPTGNAAPAADPPQPQQETGQAPPPSPQPAPVRAAPSEVVQPLPQHPAASPQPSQPVRQAQAPASIPAADVQGPPAPGPARVETAAAPGSTAPASATGQPAPAAQLNAIALAQASSVTPPAPPPPASTAGVPQPNPEATRTLAEIIRAIDVPESERRPSVVAVDLTEIEKLQAARRAERLAAAEKAKADKAKKEAAAKAKAEADAKAKKEAEEKARLAANPSRNWVQVGTGADKGALAFTLRTLRKKYDAVAPQDGWIASWGRTNRLLIGPFTSAARAKAVEADLKKAGADAFIWQSDAGEVVERLGGK